MSQIRIGAETFDLATSVNDASLGDLYVLKTKTRSPAFAGVSVKSIAHTFERIGVASKVDGFETIDLLDDEEFIINMVGLVFLARRKAGETITVEQAGRVAFTDLEFIDDDDDDEPEVEAPLGEATAAAAT